jgi:hypothetical protein
MQTVDVFVASGKYSHIGLGVGHVRVFVDTHIASFVLVKTLDWSWGLELVLRACVGASHPHVCINKSNLMSSLEGVPKLTH